MWLCLFVFVVFVNPARGVDVTVIANSSAIVVVVEGSVLW